MHIHTYDVVLFAHIAVAIASFMIAAALHMALILTRGARRDPLLWLLAHTLTGAFLGIVFLMSAKPTGAISPVIAVAGAAAGAATAIPFLRTSRPARARAEGHAPLAPVPESEPASPR